MPNVDLVINYDPPHHARTYVHRVGRTARAGKSGQCITMLKLGQIGEFNKMRCNIGGGELSVRYGDNTQHGLACHKYRPKLETLSHLDPIYKNAVRKMQRIFEDEETGILSKSANICR